MKRIIFSIGLVILFGVSSASERINIREAFKNNEAVIYTINIRNFAAEDKNNDGIINPLDGDIKGTFLNAKEKLKNLKKDGINTVYLLPITPSGKLKALGTAGSLYAMDSFDKINPEPDDETNSSDVFEEAKEFVNEAHKLGLNVIVDLPSCASYDLSLKKPDWFIADKNAQSIVPADWYDVRLLKIYEDDNKTINKQNLENFKSFVDLVQALDFDGIRADVAAIRPKEFWMELISYARSKNEKFLFLAEASPDWKNPAPAAVSHYSSIQELLEAGFDSYYGSWSDFKNIKTKAEFDSKIEKNLKILKKYKDKSMIAAFATHDQQAPILRGKNYWQTILWLNVTLPLNSYFLDGFVGADDFIYPYENQKAQKSLTDDEYYFVHSGLFDIFNNTAPVRVKHPEYKVEFIKAISFREKNKDLLKDGKLRLLNTQNESVYAFSLSLNNKEIIVAGSLDEDNIERAKIKSNFLGKSYLFSFINGKNHPVIEKNILNITLEPLEIQVYLINQANSQANLH